MSSYTRLSAEDRECISILLHTDLSCSKIASMLERSISTIIREIMRNGSGVAYRVFPAHSKARERQRDAHRKELRLEADDELKALVLLKLRLFWSTKQRYAPFPLLASRWCNTAPTSAGQTLILDMLWHSIHKGIGFWQDRATVPQELPHRVPFKSKRRVGVMGLFPSGVSMMN